LIASRVCRQVFDLVNTPDINPAAAVRAVAERVRADSVAHRADSEEAAVRRNDRAGE